MDTVTQAVFGAVIGQAGFQSKLGWRALAAGAALATVPDLDVFASFSDPLNEWEHHRGITHSLFFGPVIGPLFGIAIWKSYEWRLARGANLPPKLADPKALAAWIWLSILAFITHPMLDVLTPYGTQLLAPFSDQRFAINAMSIIDPVYTGVLAAALLGGWALYRWRPDHAAWTGHLAGAAILLSVMWQGYAWSINNETERTARAALAEEGVTSARVIAYPTLFQPWFRRITAETDDAIRVGFYSPLADRPIEWLSYPKPDSELILAFERTREYRILERFAMGEVAWRVEPRADGSTRVEAHDLRYLGMDTSRLTAMWGVGTDFSADAEMKALPTRFSNRPTPSADIFTVMWVGAFGE